MPVSLPFNDFAGANFSSAFVGFDSASYNGESYGERSARVQGLPSAGQASEPFFSTYAANTAFTLEGPWPMDSTDTQGLGSSLRPQFYGPADGREEF